MNIVGQDIGRLLARRERVVTGCFFKNQDKSVARAWLLHRKHAWAEHLICGGLLLEGGCLNMTTSARLFSGVFHVLRWLWALFLRHACHEP